MCKQQREEREVPVLFGPACKHEGLDSAAGGGGGAGTRQEEDPDPEARPRGRGGAAADSREEAVGPGRAGRLREAARGARVRGGGRAAGAPRGGLHPG